MAGVTSVIDALAWAICDDGEGIIIPQPFYTGFAFDIPTRARGVVIPAPFQDIEDYKGFDDVFDARMNAKTLANALEQAASKGIKAKAVILTNPHNPLGRCYVSHSENLLSRRKGSTNMGPVCGSNQGDRPFLRPPSAPSDQR